MVITVLEARLEPGQVGKLKSAYQKLTGTGMPTGVQESFLVQSTNDPVVWQLVGIWKSREVFEEYRNSVPTPRGVLMFREAGVEPSLALFEVVESNQRVAKAA